MARKKKPTKSAAASPRKKQARRGRGRGSVGREAIISAARIALRHTSPAKLNRKQVAAAAGVDPNLVRYYFSDLHNLLTEVLKVLVSDYVALQREATVEFLSPSEALRVRIKNLVSFLTREPSFHVLFIEQVVYGEDKWATQTRNSFTDNYFKEQKAIFNKGRELGIFRDDFDSRFLYLMIIGASEFLGTSGPIFERLFGGNAKPENFADAYADFLYRVAIEGIGTGKKA